MQNFIVAIVIAWALGRIARGLYRTFSGSASKGCGSCGSNSSCQNDATPSSSSLVTLSVPEQRG